MSNEHVDAINDIRECRGDWCFPPGTLRTIDVASGVMEFVTTENSCPFCASRYRVEWWEYEHDTGASYPKNAAECAVCWRQATFITEGDTTTFTWTIEERDLDLFIQGQVSAYWQEHADALARKLAEAEARCTYLKENRDQMYRAMTIAQDARTAAEEELTRLRLRIKFGDLPESEATDEAE